MKYLAQARLGDGLLRRLLWLPTVCGKATRALARVDGASWGQVMTHVQVPLVLPALGVAVALRSVDAFRIFATPLVLVGIEGLPVLTSVAYHYKVDLNDVSAANVTALTLALGLVLIAVFAFLVLRRHGRMA